MKTENKLICILLEVELQIIIRPHLELYKSN